MINVHKGNQSHQKKESFKIILAQLTEIKD